MNDERFIEEIITKFLLRTCRLRPQLTKHALLALVQCLRTSSWFDIHVGYSHIRILSRRCQKLTIASLETGDTRRIYRIASRRVA